MKNNQINKIKLELTDISIKDPLCMFDVLYLKKEIQDWENSRFACLWDLQYRVKNYHSSNHYPSFNKITNKILSLREPTFYKKNV
jgi:hypothetical protein